MPGPRPQVSLGPNGTIRATGFYIPQIKVPANTGISAAGKYAKGLLALFPPRYAITLSNGDVLRVNWNPAPFRGQILPAEPGWSVLPVNIPYTIDTTNSI